MAKKKKRKRPLKIREKNMTTVRYVCNNCKAEEEVPEDVLEYFDDINPRQLIFGTHEFTCEYCEVGVMKPANDVKPIELEDLEYLKA
jgi:hypothetical protein